MLLVLFAFIAGFVTVLSPCILPVLPIVLSGSLTGGHRRPIGIVTGFILSFTLFTLFLSTLVRATGISPNLLRNLSVVIIFLFGTSLLIPNFQFIMEKLFTKLSGIVSGSPRQSTGFVGGLLLGVSLGLVWTPCVGPIIASVIALAATSTVTANAIFITFAYATGTAIPMLLITFGGRKLLQKVPWLLRNTGNIQKTFGLIMILVAIGLFFGVDRTFQSYILEKFPQYGVGLTKIEDNTVVKNSLKNLSAPTPEKQALGKPMDTSAYPQAPELIMGGKWFNTNPLTLQSLRGKVVLVDFWTYTCINCIRTLPYIKSWYGKYKDQGFVVIGVHTPEFEFEKDAGNVEKALSDFHIEYPVMQDNDYATWNAYSNEYWPAHYLIDKNGKIRETHFGEGAYDETEKNIQALLKETGAKVNEKVDNKPYSIDTLSPETYLGASRFGQFASPETPEPDSTMHFTNPTTIPLNTFAFGGNWNIGAQTAMPSEGSVLSYHFNAKDVYLVINTKNDGSKIQLFLDGNPILKNVYGSDVENGEIIVSENRLYHLFHASSSQEHTIQLRFKDNNASVYAFTFG